MFNIYLLKSNKPLHIMTIVRKINRNCILILEENKNKKNEKEEWRT